MRYKKSAVCSFVLSQSTRMTDKENYDSQDCIAASRGKNWQHEFGGRCISSLRLWFIMIHISHALQFSSVDVIESSFVCHLSSVVCHRDCSTDLHVFKFFLVYSLFGLVLSPKLVGFWQCIALYCLLSQAACDGPATHDRIQSMASTSPGTRHCRTVWNFVPVNSSASPSTSTTRRRHVGCTTARQIYCQETHTMSLEWFSSLSADTALPTVRYTNVLYIYPR